MRTQIKSFASPAVIFFSILVASATSGFAANQAATAVKNPVVQISTSMGKMKVELYKDKAPISTENFLSYVKDKHYNGTIFHRVIKGFMIQGGDYDKKMKPRNENLKAPIQNEANNGLKNTDGTLAMARTSDPNSATDQFFINVVDNPFLDYSPSNPGYAVFGKVIDGLDVAHKISMVPTTTQDGMSDVPVKPVVIKSIKVVKK